MPLTAEERMAALGATLTAEERKAVLGATYFSCEYWYDPKNDNP